MWAREVYCASGGGVGEGRFVTGKISEKKEDIIGGKWCIRGAKQVRIGVGECAEGMDLRGWRVGGVGE